jgi:hypothetical protein
MDEVKARTVGQVSCEPMVGIFWLYNSGLIVHGMPLPEAEKYGDCLTSPISHIDYWTELQHNGKVSRDVEYEEPPRGRVVFDVGKQQFVVYADRCILTRQDVVRQIVAQMALPSDVTTATDAHYRCYRCIYHPRTSMEQDG